MSMNINEVLKSKCMNNYNYYKARYNKKFSNMLNYSLMDKENMIGGLSRYVCKREDSWLLETIFESCNSDYSHIPEVLVLQYEEYFPEEVVKLCKDRCSQWEIDYNQYL